MTWKPLYPTVPVQFMSARSIFPRDSQESTRYLQAFLSPAAMLVVYGVITLRQAIRDTDMVALEIEPCNFFWRGN